MIIAFLLSLACVTIAVMMLRFNSLKKRVSQQLNEVLGELRQLQRNHNLLMNADLSFAKQLAEANRQILSLDKQVQSLENKRENDGAYQHALRILEMGGDKEEIISSCHLSNAEAELLMNLHAYRAVIKTHPNRVNS
ncbi:DUF2802 domain-containing protein [Legionella jordanis]|uniref:DUF2802 domain-containing protein n=1 Tax=Legionella jordanis TaxID=456 RepID=A0A0W0V8R7_9GAMM|nr:DUF2802 domain-containing protein [Legionella jordanis]KTD16495.1 hypothetical protein Ljor_0801 [Legionella jordanis]RMX03958.1 DUF2802 domain-containing protein [Legionella jordanis]RMX21973.1 DUF2802 domain-containing protein [Legionella jordanis]VEH12045.1 Protein of uncharacterised function (DUF2802) [Legionella jordanis]HAT8712654.1 DUF2802 domain-containing protein [Legionella jordanis]